MKTYKKYLISEKRMKKDDPTKPLTKTYKNRFKVFKKRIMMGLDEMDNLETQSHLTAWKNYMNTLINVTL